jgi:predicted peroxiredoxin
MDELRDLDPLRFLEPALAAEIRAASMEVDTTLFAVMRGLTLAERIAWSHARAATLELLKGPDGAR